MCVHESSFFIVQRLLAQSMFGYDLYHQSLVACFFLSEKVFVTLPINQELRGAEVSRVTYSHSFVDLSIFVFPGAVEILSFSGPRGVVTHLCQATTESEEGLRASGKPSLDEIQPLYQSSYNTQHILFLYSLFIQTWISLKIYEKYKHVYHFQPVTTSSMQVTHLMGKSKVHS